jgi:hypothetical protein
MLPDPAPSDVPALRPGGEQVDDPRRSRCAGVVQQRVVDRDLEPYEATGTEGGRDDVLDLIPSKPAWLTVVDGGHELVVEHVDVEVQPEAIELRPSGLVPLPR